MIPLRTYHRAQKPEGPVEIDWMHPLAQGLRRYVPLNEGAGLPFDYVNGERATVQSVVPDWGIQDGIRAPWFSGTTKPQAGWGLSNVFPLTAMTLLATVCRTGVTSYNHVASQWPGYGFAQLGNPHLSFSMNAGGGAKHVSMGLPTENEWHTFCGTWDGAMQSGYRDAVLIASAAQTGVIPKSEPFRIGRYQGSNTTTYNGFIGIVAIWDRALSPAEVAWVTAEPYALLRPRVRRLFYVGAGGGVDDLSAVAFEGAAPVVAAPSFGQGHSLIAASVAGQAPIFAPAVFGQGHGLSGGPLAGAAVLLGQPFLTGPGVTALTAQTLTGAAPVMAGPILGQRHGLIAGAAVGAASALGTPLLEQQSVGHGLSAASVSFYGPALGAPALWQHHRLAALGVAVQATAPGTPGLNIPLAPERRTLRPETRTAMIAQPRIRRMTPPSR